MGTPQQRGAAAVGSIHVQTLPRLPQIQPWLKSNRPEDKTLVRFGEWFDQQMELWRRQVESSLVGNFNTIRLLATGQVSGLTPEEVKAMIDEALGSIQQGDTIIQGVTLEQVTEIVNAANATFIHFQGAAAALWTIVHNLGRYPPVSVVDSAENVVGGNINYLDSNSLTAEFAFAFSGKAYLG